MQNVESVEIRLLSIVNPPSSMTERIEYFPSVASIHENIIITLQHYHNFNKVKLIFWIQKRKSRKIFLNGYGNAV